MGRGVVDGLARRFPDPVGPDSREYVDPEWLYDLALLVAHSVGDVPGVLLFTGALALLSALSVVGLTSRKDATEGALVLAAIGVAGSTFHFTARPQAAFLVLLPLVMWLARRRRHGLLLLVGLVWTQSHSSMVLLPVVAALAMHPRDRKDWGTVACCAALVLVAGPFRLEIFDQLFGHGRIEGVHDMTPMPLDGWLPWGMLEHNRSLAPLILEGLLLVGVGMAVKTRRVRWGDVGLALLGLALALSARRFVASGCLLALPLAAPFFHERAWPRSAGLLALLGLAAYGSWLRPPSLSLDPSSVPIGAAEVLDDLPAGQLFNDYDVGGYLGWATPHRVSIDGRTPTHFGAEEFADALRISQDPPRFFAIEKSFTAAVVDRRSPLCRALSSSDAWGGVWTGESAAVFLPDLEDVAPVCAGPNELLSACSAADRSALEAMLDSAPSSHHAARMAALHHIECSGDLDEGERLLLVAEAIQPDHAENSWIRGMLALRRGDIDEALFWLDRAPNHPPSQRAAEAVRSL